MIRSPVPEQPWQIPLLFTLIPPSATLRRYLSRTTPLVIVYSTRMVRKSYLLCPTTANWMSVMRGRSERKSRNNPASWVMLPFGNGREGASCYISRSVNFGMMTTSKRPRVLSLFFSCYLFLFLGMFFFFFNSIFPTSIAVAHKNDLLLLIPRRHIHRLAAHHLNLRCPWPKGKCCDRCSCGYSESRLSFVAYTYRPCQLSGYEGSWSLVSLFRDTTLLPLCSTHFIWWIRSEILFFLCIFFPYLPL